MPKFLTHKQGSSEWLISRIGLLTASKMQDVTSVLKNGASSEKRYKLMLDIISERRTGEATNTFTSKAMERGITEEPKSRARYEEVTGNLVELVGLAIDDHLPQWGASCDGLVGEDGCVEFKNPNTSTLIDYQIKGVMPDTYRSQCLTQLAITGRKWCDFFAYDSRIRDDNNYFLFRFEPEQIEIERIRTAAGQFLVEVEQLMSKLTKTKEI